MKLIKRNEEKNKKLIKNKHIFTLQHDTKKYVVK